MTDVGGVRGHRLLTAALALALLTAACGGGDDGTIADADPSTTATAAPDGEDLPDSSTTSTTSTTTSTTTTTTVPPVPTLDPDEIHDLVVEWADGTGDPLDLAERVGGFPLPIPVASGSTPFRLEVTVFGGDETTRNWEWGYSAFAPGPVGDVDITLDDNGAGAVELQETYDPILAELGFGYSNATGSDPGEPGGPNSINRVYVSDETFVVGGAEVTANPAFMWLSEDLVFDGPEEPGWRIEVSFDVPDDVVPVPLLAALAEAVPVGDDARIHDATLRSSERPADSFAAAEGLRYLDAELAWSVPGRTDAEVQEALIAGLDGEVLQPGEESFFDEGTIEPVEASTSGGDWQLPVIVIGRYEGTLSATRDDSGDGVLVFLNVRMEPNRELLGPPVD